MNDSNNNPGNTPSKRKWLFPLGVAAIAISSIVVVSCFHDDDPPTLLSGGTDGNELPIVEEGPSLEVSGTGLACDSVAPTATTDASALMVNSTTDTTGIAKHNISFQVEMGDVTNRGSWNNHNAGNNLKRLDIAVPGQTPDGSAATVDDGPDGIPDTGDEVLLGDVRPLLASYGEQVIGEFEGGDGSADVGDPNNIDDIFVSLSMDNGKSWKKFNSVSDTAVKTSKKVSWGPLGTIDYPGHSHKPTMHIQGNNILVAWNDKYCPNGDPFELVDNISGELVDPEQPDLYKVNGTQGSIDYEGILALPNDKPVYEVPFSCVWTARGEFVLDPEGDGSTMYTIQWRKAQQLTSGTRDSNKIWIAPADVGFAITWQEDPVGLRPGKGEGPGAGWSGATTNHGADIWYTYIGIDQFDDVCADTDCTAAIEDPTPADILALNEKPEPAVSFTYPVRITNNEICVKDDTKLYCNPEVVPENCVGYLSVTSNSGKTTERCVQNDLDYMVADSSIQPQAAILDGDTGASRPALQILKTNADPAEYVAILAYEETKGLSESDPQDQGTTDTDIAREGKGVYFESFLWDQPVTVSAGRVVNTFVPEVTEINLDGSYTTSSLMIYENARRVVIMPQVDPCEAQNAGDPTFALLYKQGYETQGGPSDMFVRVNYGFTYDDFGPLDNREVTNISSHNNTEVNGDGEVIWDINTSLDEQSYDNPFDNTFSPRGWLRGSEVYTGFEYSPLWRATQVGTVPNDFWIHRFVDSTWQGPMQISIVKNIEGMKVSTIDPRFIPTPKGSAATGLTSDESNPDVIFLAYGTFDMTSGDELDLFYTRSTDKGATWEYLDANGDRVVGTVLGADGIPDTADDPADRLAKLAADQAVHEMEVQGLASPDGTMIFNAWLEETAGPVDEADASQLGLESRFGRVDYDTEVVVPE